MEAEPGLHVMRKVDRGPGRDFTELLAELRCLGFYLYPGVPNSTAVSRETNGNYGPMKTGFRSNLKELVDERIMANVSMSLAPIWLALFSLAGGTI